jgi:small subunit ribosomal protein S13
MARIAGVDLPRNKRGVIGLTYIYGIGRTLASQILNAAGVSEQTKIQDWSDDNIKFISKYIQDEFKVEGELRSEVQLKYQTSDGYCMLQRSETQKRFTCERSEYQNEC